MASTGHPGVLLRGLRKTYPSPSGPVEAVRELDLAIEAGETVALLGANGAGKSTTLDLLLGLQRPDAGSAQVLGLPPQAAVAAGRVGAMLQTGGLLRDLTVAELLRMIAAIYPAPRGVEETLALTGLGELARRRTQGLSGGQAQRVRLAVALVGDPELLVLDEPTVGMDVEARREFWATVRSLAAAGRTILFATHYLQEADAFADRVVLMAHGRIVADGSPAAVKSMVGLRTIRATLPGVPLERLEGLPGVRSVARRGDTVELACTDSDATIRALLAREPGAYDIEIAGAALEEAFVRLTGDQAPERAA